MNKMTVREFIQEHPDAHLDLMTPGGYVYLGPEQTKAAMRGEPISAHNGYPEDSMKIAADGVLDQVIFMSGQDKDNPLVFHMLTDVA